MNSIFIWRSNFVHQAFMGGKLKLAGNIMLAQKLGDVLNAARQSKL